MSEGQSEISDANPLPFAVDETSVSQSLRERQSLGWKQRRQVPLDGLMGDCSGRRLWAGDADFLIAVVASMLLTVSLPDFDPLLKGLSFYLFYLLYFQLFEYFFGATPGKWWFGLRVRAFNGSRPSFAQIAIRTAWRILEVNPIFVGLFPALISVAVTRRHIRLGDLMAGTVVVRVENLN